MVERSQPLPITTNGYFIRTTAFGVIKILRWITPPLITVATLLLTMFLYDIPMREHYHTLAAITFLVTFFIFREVESIRPKDASGNLINLGNLLFSWALIVGVLLLLGYATKSSHVYSRLTLFTWFTITPLPLLLSEIALNRLNIALVHTTGNTRKAVIAGVTDLSQRLVNQFMQDPSLATEFMGYFEDRNLLRTGPLENGRVLSDLSGLADYVRNNNIDVIYINLPIRNLDRTKKLLDQLHDTTASIYFVPDIFAFDLIQARTYDINGIPAVALCETPFVGISGLLKRISDLIIAGLAVLLISPIMFAIALGVRFTSRGPIIFKQRRYGLDGHEILIYKFRTMYVTQDSTDIPQATRNDPRVTPFGAFLRHYSLDELPQLFNVLQGRMSVVGPRPHAVAHNETYRKLIKGYMVRHKVLPGITGLAQVNGFRGETSKIEHMEKRIECDLNYLRHWSLQLDIQILFKTIMVVLNGKNAY